MRPMILRNVKKMRLFWGRSGTYELALIIDIRYVAKCCGALAARAEAWR